MQIPPPSELIAALRAIPAGALLLDALGEDQSVPVHVVGGAVRDLLLGRPSGDLDLVSEGPALAVAQRLGGSVRAHDRFGTVTVTLPGANFDIAQSRRERYPQPGALPEVTAAALTDDLGRRDFTVNAIAITLTGTAAGTLQAVPRALEDLDAHRLRVLHAGSFADDPTRLLRLTRYAARLGFEVEPETLELCREAVAGGPFTTISGPRLGNELRLLASERDPLRALVVLHDLGLDKPIEPGFGLTDPDALQSALELLPDDGRRDRLALAAASRGVEPGRLRRRLDELGFEAADREAIASAAAGAAALAVRLGSLTRPSEIAAAVDGGGPELVALAGALGAQAPATSWLAELRHVAPAIDGDDLIAAGIPEGPAVGAGLRAALAARLDGTALGRDAELAVGVQAARAMLMP